ncbi:hypothetical protein BDW72DRAFT_110931 [Aspergillus terricola var. indicus]
MTHPRVRALSTFLTSSNAPAAKPHAVLPTIAARGKHNSTNEIVLRSMVRGLVMHGAANSAQCSYHCIQPSCRVNELVTAAAASGGAMQVAS